MADDPIQPPAEETPAIADASTTEQTKPQAQTLKQAVADKVASSGAQVRDIVVNQLADEEIQKRAVALRKGCEQFEANERELRKIVPATVGFDENEKPIKGTTFTKEQSEQRKKLKETNTKLNNALDKALNSNDYTKLFELVGK